MPFTEGESVGPYRLIEQLGQGGMATVFKAYHAALDRYVAIKALHPAFTQEANFLTRFQREAQVVARLEHPNIVPIYDYAEHEGRPYLVMKFIEGETLKARLSQGDLAHDEMMKIVESVGAALEYAHQQGVLHRDVKPSNVLLAKDGRIYLADFGLARMAQAGESTISSDVMLGTPQYISPEQAKGARNLDGGTDIYSFGVLLYELLVGRVPYSADTPYSIIHDHIYAPLPLPRNIKPEIPEAVERVLLKALAKEREDRFPDVVSMIEAWKRAWSGQAVAPVEAEAVAESAAVQEAAPAAGVAAKGAETLQVPADEIPEGSSGVLPGQVQPAEPETAKEKGGKKSWRNWIFAFGLLAMICLCVFFVLVALQRQRRQAVAERTDTPVVAQADATVTLPAKPKLTPALPPTHVPPQTRQPGVRPTLVNNLDMAVRRVTAEPNSALAHLALAAAYLDAGMNDEAEVEFSLAKQLAGENNPAFYNRAGEFFLARQRWVLAADAFAQAIQYTPEPAPNEMMENFMQALYLASAEVPVTDLVDAEVLGLLHGASQEILNARYMLYQGDVSGAQAIVQRILDHGDPPPETKLLQAEIHMYEGDKDSAKPLLTSLEEDVLTPQWIRLVAEYLLNEISK
ncbi:MAG: serine/threonine-protein kinase [Chloroflexota bacterium]